MDCKLEFFHYSKHDRGLFVRSHKHSCFELVYYISGKGSTEIGNKKYTYLNNTFTLIIPGTEHNEMHDEDAELFFAGFSYDNLPIKLENGLYSDNAFNDLYHLFKEIEQEIIDKDPFYKLKVDLLLQQIIIEIGRLCKNESPGTDEFSYIKNYIKENYSINISINNLAKLSGYSYHHFRHAFKKKTGMSPMNYIISVRIENSKKLLENRDLKLLEIAQICGFASSSQFCSLFKKYTQETPLGYRKVFMAGSSKE